MAKYVEHLRFVIPDIEPVRPINLGPIIDPPFIDGLSGKAEDGAIQLTNVKHDILPPLLSEDVALRARNTAEADARVVTALGPRSEFVGVGMIDRKDRDKPDLQVMWYAYETNQTVVAITDNSGEVIRDVRLESDQPALTAAEEARANEIVTNCGRLPDARDGRGLLVEVTDRGSPRYGNRIVDLCFHSENTRLPCWWALVDLSTDELIGMGEVPQAK